MNRPAAFLQRDGFKSKQAHGIATALCIPVQSGAPHLLQVYRF